MDNFKNKDYINEEIENNLTEEYERIKKIIKCLNDFEEIAISDSGFRTPLNLSKKDLNKAYEQIILKIKYLKESVVIEKSFEELCLLVFELLFLKYNKINHEYLDEKLYIFEIILSSLRNKPEEEKEEVFINKVKERKKEWKIMIENFSYQFGGIAFIFCVFLYYSKSIEKIVEFFIYFLKTLYNCIPRFDLKELKGLSEASIAKDLLAFIENTTDYFYIIIKGGHIKKFQFSPEEMEKIINAK